MKISGINRHLHLDEAGPEGDSGSATTTAPPPPPPARTFTQDDLDQAAAKQRRAYERNAREQQADFDRKLAEAQAKAGTQTTQTPTDDPTGAGLYEVEKARWERSQAELKAQIERLEGGLATERQTRKELERDRQLDEAMAAVGIPEKNFKLARRFFLPDIVWDEIDGAWLFKTPKDNLIGIRDGVEEFLPENLRPSRIRNGGAGTSGGLPAAAARTQRDLEQAKAALAQAEAALKKRPSDNALLTKFSTAKQKVKQLELDLAKSIK